MLQPCEPLTVKTIRRFAKDFLLPIPVYEPKYLNYYLNLYDGLYHTKDKYNLLIATLNKHGGNEPLYSYSVQIRTNAENIIKNRESYQRFISNTNDIFTGHKWKYSAMPRGQVYKEFNDGKQFFSIDLTKANYQALKWYSRYIVQEDDNEDNLIMGTHNFDEFISLFSEDEYFHKAKKFREILFGYINPKRQQIIQKYLVEKIVIFCIDNSLFNMEDIRDYTSDEIVFALDDQNKANEYRDIINHFAKKNDLDIHIDVYTLRRLNPYDYYVREMDNSEIDFKGIESSLMAQCYKHYFGINVLVDEDLIFLNSNHLLAKYIEPLQFN